MSVARLKADAMLDQVNIDQLSVNEIMRLFQENCLQFDMMCHEGQEVQMKADCFPWFKGGLIQLRPLFIMNDTSSSFRKITNFVEKRC